MFKNSWIHVTLLFAFYLMYQEKPIDISLSPFLKFLILKQFYALVLYNLWPVYQIVISYVFVFLVDLNKHDLRTVLCKNLESIAQDCNVQSRNLNKFCVKQHMIYNHIPLDQEWKLPILRELLKVKEDNFVLNNFVDTEIATMINFLCSD